MDFTKSDVNFKHYFQFNSQIIEQEIYPNLQKVSPIGQKSLPQKTKRKYTKKVASLQPHSQSQIKFQEKNDAELDLENKLSSIDVKNMQKEQMNQKTLNKTDNKHRMIKKRTEKIKQNSQSKPKAQNKKPKPKSEPKVVMHANNQEKLFFAYLMAQKQLLAAQNSSQNSNTKRQFDIVVSLPFINREAFPKQQKKKREKIKQKLIYPILIYFTLLQFFQVKHLYMSNINVKKQLETILKQGFLEKQSRFLKTWRKYFPYKIRRWFVLTMQTLMTFKERKQYNSPTQVVQLKDIVSIKSCDEQIHKEFSFRVDTKNETFYIGASSNTQKQQWIGQIGKAMVKLNILK